MENVKSVKEKSYILSFDILNIVACISVVALHVNGAFWWFAEDKRWVLNNIIECIGYFAVPVFFMLSGATLMDYRERYSTKQFFKKRILKTFLPFIFWSIFGIIYNAVVYKSSGFDSDKGFVLNVIDSIFNTEAVGIYWFFRALFAVYLSIPVLSLIPKEKRKRIFSYAFAAAFVTISVLPLLFKVFGLYFSGDYQISAVGGYLLFVLAGYLIANYKIDKKHRIIIYVLGVLGLAAHFLGTVLSSFKAGEIVDTYKGYTNLPAVLWSIAVFVFFYYRDYNCLKKPKIIKAVRTVSSASFGVYLIHYFVLNSFVVLFKIDMATAKWVLIGTPAVYLVSLAFTLAVKKIPFVNKILP